MNVRTLADHWGKIVSAILGTLTLIGLMGRWLDHRIEEHVSAATEQNVMAINALKCAIKDIDIIDCDTRAGLD